MHALGKLLRLPRLELRRALVLAGGAAGIAAAFNTPLAGIVFAIEELSHSFEARTSGTVFTAVVVAGATTLGLVGNYTYFGQTSAELTNNVAWLAVIVCSVAGGLAGGLFSQALIVAARGLPGWAGRMIIRYPVGFAALCAAAAGDHRHPRPAARHTAPATRKPAAWSRNTPTLPAVYAAAETGGHGGVLCQRHPRRHLRPIPLDRRGARGRSWRRWFPAHRSGR